MHLHRSRGCTKQPPDDRRTRSYLRIPPAAQAVLCLVVRVINCRNSTWTNFVFNPVPLSARARDPLKGKHSSKSISSRRASACACACVARKLRRSFGMNSPACATGAANAREPNMLPCRRAVTTGPEPLRNNWGETSIRRTHAMTRRSDDPSAAYRPSTDDRVE